MGLYFLKGAGLVSFDAENWTVHFGVYPSHWQWGRSTEPYNYCMEYFGIGPLVLVCVDAVWWWQGNEEEDYVYE